MEVQGDDGKCVHYAPLCLLFSASFSPTLTCQFEGALLA